ncbi:hypothetical protein GCM10020358_01830 [Amorphoplanes nipponensis]
MVLRVINLVITAQRHRARAVPLAVREIRVGGRGTRFNSLGCPQEFPNWADKQVDVPH